MPIYQLTTDMVEQLETSYKNKQNEYDKINNTTTTEMWKFDLDEFSKSIETHMKNESNKEQNKKRKTSTKRGNLKTKK